MLRLSLADHDVVLVVLPRTQARYLVEGSYPVQCAECDVVCWRAPMRPPVQLTPDGLRPAPVGTPDPTVLLCPTCASFHAGLLQP